MARNVPKVTSHSKNSFVLLTLLILNTNLVTKEKQADDKNTNNIFTNHVTSTEWFIEKRRTKKMIATWKEYTSAAS